VFYQIIIRDSESAFVVVPFFTMKVYAVFFSLALPTSEPLGKFSKTFI
jgi:hypothetical protein